MKSTWTAIILLLYGILLVERTRSAEYRLPGAVIPAGAAATCPSVEEVKEVKNYVHQVIIDDLNFTLACGQGPWYPVARLNISDPSQQCPSNWSVYSSNGVRACRRKPSSTAASCDGVFFPVGHHYNKICGRTFGYQLGSVDAFTNPTVPEFVNTSRAIDGMIDGAYVDGVSITHGSPRNHIWTFAAGSDPRWLNWTCPCIQSYTGPGPQAFVGDHYFCESGNGAPDSITAENDKLWDGQQCSERGSCCNTSTASLQWFTRELPNPTGDEIEVRICGDENTYNEDTPVELVEIYVNYYD